MPPDKEKGPGAPHSRPEVVPAVSKRKTLMSVPIVGLCTQHALATATLLTPAGGVQSPPQPLQWIDRCPHMGSAEKTLLHVLCNLATDNVGLLLVTPERLRLGLYSGPVDPGDEPKTMSLSGTLRLLRSLASLGQIANPDGDPATFSRSSSAMLMIQRTPAHECPESLVFAGGAA